VNLVAEHIGVVTMCSTTKFTVPMYGQRVLDCIKSIHLGIRQTGNAAFVMNVFALLCDARVC